MGWDGKDGQAELQGTFYAMRKEWMTPLRLSVFAPILMAFLAAFAVWGATAVLVEGVDPFLTASGGFLSMVLLFCMALPTMALCNSPHILYVRTGRELWRVDLNILYSIQDWEKVPASRQEAVEQDILRRIQAQKEEEGIPWRFGGLVRLKKLQVEGEDRWSWKVSYEAEFGSRRKLSIGKGYPNFAPDRGLERPQGPVPARWSFPLIALVLTAALMAGSYTFALSLGTAEQEPVPEPSLEAEPTTEPVRVPTREPDYFTEYEMSEVWFRVDAEYQVGRRTFLDGETGTLYRVYVQYGVDTHGAWDTLAQRLSDYHLSPLYDRFDAVYLAEDPLVPLGESDRYNILSVYLTDGRAFHTAVVLSDDGTLFTMEASHDCARQSAEDVLGSLMYTLESVRFGGPAVTEEDYQSQIHVSQVRDCQFMAAAYLKTDIFGHDAFVDVYVPYSEQLIYSSDGRAVRSEAHGLRVYVTILPGEDAKSVIDAQYQALAASGRAYEEDLGDELYWEDSDVACKLTVYEEDGQRRYAVLYADPKWEGYYLFREFTGLPELVDGDYPAGLAELERLCGLTMPALEALGQAEP